MIEPAAEVVARAQPLDEEVPASWIAQGGQRLERGLVLVEPAATVDRARQRLRGRVMRVLREILGAPSPLIHGRVRLGPRQAGRHARFERGYRALGAAATPGAPPGGPAQRTSKTSRGRLAAIRCFMADLLEFGDGYAARPGERR